jgi:hypothetical protein
MAEPPDQQLRNQLDPSASASTVGTPIPGATVTPVYVNRRMKAYCIHEHEVDIISTMNTLSTAFFSIASGLIFFAFGLLANAAFYVGGKLPPAADILCAYGVPAAFVLAIIFIGLGFWARWRRAATWTTIRNESESK